MCHVITTPKLHTFAKYFVLMVFMAVLMLGLCLDKKTHFKKQPLYDTNNIPSSQNEPHSRYVSRLLTECTSNQNLSIMETNQVTIFLDKL